MVYKIVSSGPQHDSGRKDGVISLCCRKGYRKREGAEGRRARAADGSKGKRRERKGEPVKFQCGRHRERQLTHTVSALSVTPEIHDLIPL